MIKSTFKYSVMLATALALAALPVLAADSKPADKPQKPKREAGSKAEATGQVVPFHGKIASKTDSSITIGERTIQITSDTKIVKAGKPATLADAAVGEEVGGQYRTDNNKLIARSLRIGPKPEAADKDATKKADSVKPDAPKKDATKSATSVAPAAPAVK